MPKKKSARKKRSKPTARPTPHPAYGFWYPVKGGPDADVQIIIKDFKIDHLIAEECDEGDWDT